MIRENMKINQETISCFLPMIYEYLIPCRFELYWTVNKAMYSNVHKTCWCIALYIGNKAHCKIHDLIAIHVYKSFKWMRDLKLCAIKPFSNVTTVTSPVESFYLHEDLSLHITIPDIERFLSKHQISVIGYCCDKKGIIINYRDCDVLFSS